MTALGVAVAACSNSSGPVGNVASGPATEDAAKIQAAEGNRFTPATLELPAGETVTIEITNIDDTAHDFAIEAADLNTGTIPGGAVATATFAVPGGQLVAYVVAAGLAGILAAVLPGRRAAKVDMLRAITTE